MNPPSPLRRLLPYLAALLLASLPGELPAQEGLREVHSARHLYGGLDFVLGQPVGAFNTYVNLNFGGMGHLVIPVNPSGTFGFRFDGGLVIYGNQRKRVPLSSTVGGLIQVDVTTNNNIAFGSFGPQFALRTGPIRPYLNGALGFSYLFTESSASGSSSGTSFASSTNFDDWVFAYGVGGGVYVPLSRKVAINVGVDYNHGGTARYLIKGGIIDNGGGTLSFAPITSETSLVRYRLGVAFGL